MSRNIISTAELYGGLPVFDVRLGEWSSFGVGGPSRAVFPETEKELLAALAENGPKTVIGCGSNVIFSDAGYGGMTIFTSQLCKIEERDGFLRCYAGAKLSSLVSRFLADGLGGAEFLAGIPASVGGALYMNAGAFGGSIADCVLRVAVVKDGAVRVLGRDECGFGYRCSGLGGADAILYGDFAGVADGEAAARAERYLAARRFLQPSGRSFGSTFRNPAGDSAGRLIDAAGLKGFAIGGARVSEKHANFIINDGTARAADARALIAYVKSEVFRRSGALLEEEVKYIGDFD